MSDSIDPRIRAYFRLNSAAIPLRAIAISDSRVHVAIDLGGAQTTTKKWLTQTPAGAVVAETVIGGNAATHKIIVM